MNRKGSICVAAILGAAGAAIAGDELVKNGSLEGGSYEDGYDWGYVDGSPLWIQDETVWENLDINKSAWVTGEGNYYAYYFPQGSAYDGINAVDVNQGIIWQDLGQTLEAGAEYEFSVALADNGINGGDVIWNLIVFDNLVDLLLIGNNDEAMNPNAPHYFNSDDPEAPEVVYGDWIPVSFTFVANGSEQWIGVFGEDRVMADAISLMATGGGQCPADCNGDGVANILDFVCFQGEWQNQTELGDCDGNGLYNILDFVCFQGVFQQGCP